VPGSWGEEEEEAFRVDLPGLASLVYTGMIFLLEDFCGHGFERDNPAAPCYRGPNTPAYFDLTCIHPNPTGHEHIRDMFMAVVNE
jgi:hypothetical protein